MVHAELLGDAVAQHEAFDDGQMSELIALARSGIARLIEIQKEVARL